MCGGVFLFGPEPNGPPLEKMGKTNVGVDENLQNQNWIRGPGEDRENPPMPKSVRGLQGRGFRSVRVCSRERERTSAWSCTCVFIGVGAKANVRNVPVGMPGSSCLLMMERVAWGGYNRDVNQRTCSAPSGHTFRAGDPHGGSNVMFGDIQGRFAQQD
ncbi:hypothetical protein Taro_004523 [Colocasia esculenta]|uniref:Uncharacterized protein n=1 Tax=Colocasia esculenta TaxID=4460 RepID=A0A843TMB7_COLES|nr:hypothetical protein [Colocasia esculenta]